MSDQETVKFTWTINNFSKLNRQYLYSDKFFTGSHPWRILINPKAANNGKGLSIYLAVWNTDNFPIGWSIYANFKLSLVNQIDGKLSRTYGTKNHQFNATTCVYCVDSFITSHGFRDNKGFLVNDTCKIVAEVSIKNPKHENHSFGELVDFKGLCKIEKDFAQLLEQVCLKHPNVIESHRKKNRSQRFNEWSFTALARVLHFLKTKEVEYMMNDDMCNKELQNLWEELESFGGFDDLGWLEPHVQSALGIKGYLERALEVKKLKWSVGDLVGEAKSLKAKMDVVVANLEIANRELVKAQEGFVMRELDGDDDELGYGLF